MISTPSSSCLNTSKSMPLVPADLAMFSTPIGGDLAATDDRLVFDPGWVDADQWPVPAAELVTLRPATAADGPAGPSGSRWCHTSARPCRRHSPTQGLATDGQWTETIDARPDRDQRRRGRHRAGLQYA